MKLLIVDDYIRASSAIRHRIGCPVEACAFAVSIWRKSIAASLALISASMILLHPAQVEASPEPVLVKSGKPNYLAAVDGVLFFSTSGEGGTELWKTDGTAEGTVRVKDINPSGSSSPRYLFGFNGTLFFSANDGKTGYELWKSDGTENLTMLLKDINPVVGGTGSDPHDMVVIDGKLYFRADDYWNGIDWWTTDGTEEGTVRVPGFSLPRPNVNGIEFFVREDGEHGVELWKTDGTEGGAMLLKDINPGPARSDPHDLIVAGETLIFSARNDEYGDELWKSDGTEEGTVMLKDIWPGEGYSTPTDMMYVGGLVFFVAGDNVHGRELWKTDGTEAGTALVKDIYPGISSANPEFFLNVNGTLYFCARDNEHAMEVWKTDGTDEGTVRLTDLNPGDSSTIHQLQHADGTLFFEEAKEKGLWKLDLVEKPENLPPANILLLDNTVAEYQPAGAIVNYLFATDPDSNDTHTFALVAGEGSADNASFTIEGNVLKTAEVFDHDTRNSYSIRVRATDAGGLSLEKIFTINVASESERVAPFHPRANRRVNTTVVQADGKILVGGQFGSIGGQTRNSLARLNPNGTLDASFNPNPNGEVIALLVQADGNILVGGSFSRIGGEPRNRIARLYPDGSLDMSFDPKAGGTVNAILEQADGMILVGGSFTSMGGVTRNRLARLNPDGSLDPSFDPDVGNLVYSIAVQEDGKILIGGRFLTVGGTERIRIARLNPNGSLDSSFNPNANGGVVSLTLQADGKILVGGSFGMIAGESRRFARLNVDGTVDPSFLGTTVPGESRSLAMQADGKLLIGGTFGGLFGHAQRSIARANADGTFDTSFLFGGVNDYVHSVAVQADGKVLIGGDFTIAGEKPRIRTARLNNTDTATESLSFAGSTITWLRGGSSPEVWRTTFESSPDGVEWTKLGDGSRIAGGWELTGVDVPDGNRIRARGFTRGGLYSGSGGLVETIAVVVPNPAPVITSPVTIERPPGLSAKTTLDTLLASATDVEGDPLTVQSVSDTTAAGGSVIVDGKWVIYLPPDDFNETDTFTYVISDDGSKTVVGTVTVAIREHVTSPTQRGSIEILPGLGGHARVRFAGVPGRSYQIQVSDNLGGDWVTIGVQTAGGRGLYEFIDEDAADSGQRFYRAIPQP